MEYIKGEYKAIEVNDSNYFYILYNGRKIMTVGTKKPMFSLKFILDMGFIIKKI